MKRYLSFVIFIIGILSVTSKIQTEQDVELVSVREDRDITSSLDRIITVKTDDIEMNKTLTADLGQGRESAVQGRTFGIKRLQFMLLPVMYKLGVMSTLLVALVVLSLKSLLIGVILLVLKIGGLIAKLKLSSHHESHSSGPVYAWPQPAWPHHQQSQPVHIHLHNSGEKQHYHHQEYHSSPYDRLDQQQPQYIQAPSGWDGTSGPSGPYERPIGIDSHGQYVYKG